MDTRKKEESVVCLVSELSSQQFGVRRLKPFVLVLDDVVVVVVVAFHVIVADTVPVCLLFSIHSK
jgi:hypothetical protein